MTEKTWQLRNGMRVPIRDLFDWELSNFLVMYPQHPKIALLIQEAIGRVRAGELKDELDYDRG